MGAKVFLDAACTQKIENATYLIDNYINVGLFSPVPPEQSISLYIKGDQSSDTQVYFFAGITAGGGDLWSAIHNPAKFDQNFFGNTIKFEFEGKKSHSTLGTYNYSARTVECEDIGDLAVGETILFTGYKVEIAKITAIEGNTITLSNESWWNNVLNEYTQRSCGIHRIVDIGKVNNYNKTAQIDLKIYLPEEVQLNKKLNFTYQVILCW